MWSSTVGLVNGQYKYLTAESFGHKINSNGSSLKKKQIWTIDPFPMDGDWTPGHVGDDDFSEQEFISIKSHLDCYLAVDSFGNVTCHDTDRHSGSRFTITICSMSGGNDGDADGSDEQIFWAFRNVERGYFLGSSMDGTITCVAKIPQSKAELWYLHLIPSRGATMFALKSVGRKRFGRSVQSDPPNEQVQVDATLAWGSETLFSFKFVDGGRYSLMTSTGRYVTSEGTTIAWEPTITIKNGSSPNGNGSVVPLPPNECLFTLEYHGGDIAFRDVAGRYLAATGRSAVLRTRSSHVSKDELFTFEPGPVQVSLQADFNGRFVSTRQGVDLAANQSEVTADYETFQLDYFDTSDTFTIRTKDGHFWTPGPASTVQVSNVKSPGHYRLKWAEDGTASLMSADCKTGHEDGKVICARKSGQLCLSSTDPVAFHVVLRNRMTLNLRPISGSSFVGLRGQKLEVAKSSPESVIVEWVTEEDIISSCLLKSPNGRYWSVSDGQVTADAGSPSCGQQFILEIRSSSTLAIRLFDCPSYVNLSKSSALMVSKCPPNEATLWEY